MCTFAKQAAPSDKTAMEVVLECDWERELLMGEENRLLEDVCSFAHRSCTRETVDARECIMKSC